jgi:NADPH:quinone reductase-like Zn-dependent oxidoreductase
MQAVVIHEGQLEIVERDTPVPAANDVIVAVRAAGVNAADLLQLQGFYPAPSGWPPDVPGLEMAGIVSAVGSDVHEALLGRRVCAVVGGGAQATHCAVPAEHLTLIPDQASWNEAGGFAEAFTTAFDALVTQAGLREGERVLVSGASGGVGTAALQIAHQLGAHVTAATRTAEHHDALKELGADETITIEQVPGIAPVDVVLELVGAAHLTLAQEVLAKFARVVIIGVGGGNRVELDLLNIMGTRASLTGSTLRSRSREEKALAIAQVNEALVPLWTSDQLHVPLAQSFELGDARSAYEFFARRGKLGKVVLLVEQ